MIDQIMMKRITDHGKSYEVVRVWISGICFSADLDTRVEAIIRRVADKHNVEITDARPDDLTA